MSYYSDPNPYQPPPPGFAPKPQWQDPYPATPGVWYGYLIYCILMAMLYLACLGLGIVFIAFADQLSADDPDMSATEATIMGTVFAVMGGVMFLMYAIAPVLPKSKAAWIYGFVTIGIGMTSACTLPFCIALLIFWLKPETKAFFRAL